MPVQNLPENLRGYKPTAADVHQLSKAFAKDALGDMITNYMGDAGYDESYDGPSSETLLFQTYDKDEELRVSAPLGEHWVVHQMKKSVHDFMDERTDTYEMPDELSADQATLAFAAANVELLEDEMWGWREGRNLDALDKDEERVYDALTRYHADEEKRLRELLKQHNLEREDLQDDQRPFSDLFGAADGLPNLSPPPIKDPKPMAGKKAPQGFDEGREVAGSLPDGVSLRSSGYGGRYGKR